MNDVEGASLGIPDPRTYFLESCILARNRKKLLDRQEQNRQNNDIASHNFEDNDEALKLYNPTHLDENLTEAVFSFLQTLEKSESF